MNFVTLFQAAQDRDRVFDGRFADVDLLEATLERRIFSMYFLYSLSVVAPTQRSSPRASAGFNMFEASIAPSARPRRRACAARR
jgi:hypothetical protein